MTAVIGRIFLSDLFGKLDFAALKNGKFSLI